MARCKKDLIEPHADVIDKKKVLDDLTRAWRCKNLWTFQRILKKEFDFHFSEGGVKLLENMISDTITKQDKEFIAAALASCKADINKSNNDGQCLIHVAANCASFPALEALIEAGADPNVLNNKGETPLHILASFSQKEYFNCLQFLTKAPNIDINCVNARGQPPHYSAFFKGNMEAMKYLLNCGLPVDLYSDNRNELPKHLITNLKNISSKPPDDVFKRLRDDESSFCSFIKGSKKKDLLQMAIKKYTLLQHACMYNKKQAVETLLSFGADPNYIPPDNTFPPICLAAINNCTDIIRLLVKQPTIKPFIDILGQNPLHFLLLNGLETQLLLEIIKILFDAKGKHSETTDINYQDEMGRTALHLLLSAEPSNQKYKLDSIEVVASELLNHNPDVHLVDKNGKTVLHYAAQNGQHTIVNMIIDLFENIYITDKDGNTPLHLAADNYNENMLVKSGSNVNIVDQSGNTALRFATENNHDRVVLILLDHWADLKLKNNNKSSVLNFAAMNGHNAYIDIQNKNGDTALHYATRKGRETIAMMLIKHGANMDKQNNIGYTALHFAIRNGYENIAMMLVKNCACVDIQNNHGDTALHYAIWHGRKNIMKILIKQGASVDIQNNDGDTALHLATRIGDDDIAKILIEQSARVNIQNKDGCTALHYVTRNRIMTKLLYGDETGLEMFETERRFALADDNPKRRENIFQMLIEQNASVNTQNVVGDTALHLAIRNGNENIAMMLIEHGASVNIQNIYGFTVLNSATLKHNENILDMILKHCTDVDIQCKGGYTALHYATRNGDVNSTMMLLKHGANVNIQNKDGYTPLYYATQSRGQNISMMLIEHGASVDIKNKDGDTALHCASRKGDENIAILLIEHGANVDKQNNVGYTALHYAIRDGYENIAMILVKNCASVDKQNNDGDTGLHYAIWYERKNITEMLIEQGASVDIQNNDGDTALHCAIRNGYDYIAMMLVTYSANVNIQNNDGYTALHYATRGRHENTSKMYKHAAGFDIHNLYAVTSLLYAYEHITIVKMLVEKNASVNIQNNDGDTALHFAIRNGDEKIAMVLIYRLASVDIKNNDGNTTLHNAARYGHENITKMLVNLSFISSSQWNISNNDGCTALHAAARLGYVNIVNMLLNKGADADVSNNRRETILYYATSSGHKIIVEMLIKHGVKLDITTNGGDTALHVALRTGRKSIAIMLIKSGACINITNKDGFTALHLAEQFNPRNIIQEMLGNTEKAKGSTMMSLGNEAFNICLDVCIDERGPENYQLELTFLTSYVIHETCSLKKRKQRRDWSDEGSIPMLDTSNDVEIPNDAQEPTFHHSESRFLVDMMKNPQLRPLLIHPVLTSFTLLKWQRVQVFFYINLVFQLLLSLCLTGYIIIGYSSANANSTSILHVLSGQDKTASWELLKETSNTLISLRITTAVLLVFLFIREMIQFLFLSKTYLTNWENLLDIFLIVLGSLVIADNCGLIFSVDSCSNTISPQLNAAVILIAWSDLVLLISRHHNYSVHIEMFGKVSMTFLSLLFRFIIIVVAFAFSFFILFNGQKDHSIYGLWMSVFKTFLMMVGEFNSNDLDFETYHETTTIIFLFFVFFIAIVLMSLLNALAVADTRDIRNDAYLYSCIARVKFISLFEEIFVENNALIRFFDKFKCGQRVNNFLKRRITLFFDDEPKILVVKSDKVKFYVGGTVYKKPLEFDLSYSDVRDILDSSQKIVANRTKDNKRKDTIASEVSEETFIDSINQLSLQPTNSSNSDTDIGAKLAGLEQRLGRIEGSFTGLEQRLEGNLTSLEQRLTTIMKESIDQILSQIKK